ncbi:hypothetical protein NBH00_14645 [Paraconexibacter antarcticus]|uniref:LPXTG-motif cell wall-anchored protein n=1 Tax=Paraconexibacter antarcticus TaxID=2949664 RepID=A0ABY5DLA3_9ACTN|nr:hypothetical protein [Paraconexibacter antarcticus]UTI62598.1 hypothetical protein NBH00_14645 [Paraconexibacter antarcticus]
MKVLVALGFSGLLGGGVAFAASTPRDAASDQYTTTTVATTPTATVTGQATVTTPVVTVQGTVGGAGSPPTPATTGTTTKTTSPSAVSPSSGSGSGLPGDKTGSGSTPTGGATGTSGGSGAGGASGPPANRVAFLSFGKPGTKLHADVQSAIGQAGLLATIDEVVTKARFASFVASPVLKLLSADGLGKPAGQSFGAQLVNPTSAVQRAFPALLGPGVTLVPVLRVVLTRTAGLPKSEVTFLKGLASGLQSTGIPLAYVERSDVKKSFVDAFKKLHVLTVGDVNSPSGKLRLERILLGQTKTQSAVDAVTFKPAASITTDGGGSSGATPWVLLAVLLGGVGFMASGVVRRRTGRTAR